MPKRPRAHQLEDESRTRFRQIIPPQWVFRDTAPDYGIDGEVEIFDKNGVTTGMCFKVQLKATDRHDITKGLSISLGKETWNYYCSLDVPVLIVRYHSPTKRFHTRWAHTYDPYYKKGKVKNIILQFSSNDEWKKSTAERLSSEVEAIRNISSAEIKLPIKLSLLFEKNEINGVPTAEIGAAIKKLAQKVKDILDIPFSPSEENHTYIKIRDKEIFISLAGKGTFTLHISKRVSANRIRKQLPFDTLLGIGIAFHKLGQSNIGARFVSYFTERSGLVHDIHTLGILCDCLKRAHRITEALALAERLFEEQGSSPAPLFLSLPSLIKGNNLSDGEKKHRTSYLERRIKFCEEKKDLGQLACAHYNFANALGAGEGKLRRAFHHYREAARHDPSYWKRGYFLRELGGLLFLKGRYQASAHFYGLALKRRYNKRECRALYADALLYAGQYKDSQKNFKTFIKLNANSTSEWRLKARVLPTIRSVSDRQKRQPTAATKLLEDIENGLKGRIEEQLQEVLILDALCPLAWYRLGEEKLRKHAAKGHDKIENLDISQAFSCVLIAAVIENYNLAIWLRLVLLTTFMKREDRDDWLPDIACLAYRFNGEEFLTGLQKLTDEAANIDPKLDRLLQKTHNKILKILESKNKKSSSVPAVTKSGKDLMHVQIK